MMGLGVSAVPLSPIFACALPSDAPALADADALAMQRLARGEVDALGEL